MPMPTSTRPTLSYDPLTSLRNTFIITPSSRSFQKQFSNVYFLRLLKLRPIVTEKAKKKWEQTENDAGQTGQTWQQLGYTTAPIQVKRVLDVEPGKLCYISGTVYSDLKLKPNVLKDLARELHVPPQPVLNKWVSADGDDVIMLEDDSGRIKLVGLKPEWPLLTGITIAVLGSETRNGNFEVLDICYPGLPHQSPLPTFPKTVGDSTSTPTSTSVEDAWVAIVSGLDLQGEQGRPEVRTQLLAEYLNGEMGGQPERSSSHGIARLIIAGNGFAEPEREVETKKPKRYGYDPAVYSPKPGQQLDRFLSEVLPTLDVDILPGDCDPVGAIMPQQPLHHALLPLASRYAGLTMGPNPWWSEIGGATFLGTSGQNLDDIYRYSVSEDRLQMAMNLLAWSHIAPTAPDTLWCYPFSDKDPFILAKAPHVFFIGNQPEFATGLCKGSAGQVIRVVLVPKYSETGCIALLNPKTLECKQVTICQRKFPRSTKQVQVEIDDTQIDMEDDDD